VLSTFLYRETDFWNKNLCRLVLIYRAFWGRYFSPFMMNPYPEYTGIFFLWRCGPTRAMASSFLRFLDHTQRRTTVGRTPLDEWSARCRDLYLTTISTDRHTCPGRILTHDLSRRATADRRLRPHGHWDRHYAGNKLPIFRWNLLSPSTV
jgi:hypothetical protein